MNVLVTGGAGFIGSHVAEILGNDGYKVLVLDDLSGGYLENIYSLKNVEFIQGSITDYSLINTLFEKYQFENVYHFAAYAAEGLSHFIKRYNYENNLVGSVNLINSAINHGAKKFVFTSSIAVYGKNQLPMTEDLTPNPEDSYGISKLAVEKELEISHKMFGLEYIIFRPHNVYGERQNIWDRYRNVIGIFINQVLHGKPLTLFGDGTQTRAFTYIGDIAPIIAHSVRYPEATNSIFNVGSDEVTTVGNLASLIMKSMNVDLPITYLEERNEVKHAFPSHNKLKTVFSPPPPVSLEDGLHKMIKWARTAPSKEVKNFTEIEIRKNLPPSWRT